MRSDSWVRAKICPKCKAKPALGAGFERVTESAYDSVWGREVTQIQCENCGTYFGTIDTKTKRILERGQL